MTNELMTGHSEKNALLVHLFNSRQMSFFPYLVNIFLVVALDGPKPINEAYLRLDIE